MNRKPWLRVSKVFSFSLILFQVSTIPGALIKRQVETNGGYEPEGYADADVKNKNTLLNMESLPLEIFRLDQLDLQVIAEAIRPKLLENFENVTVEVVDCPDLTEQPFNLAAKGINGNVSIWQMGDDAYFRPYQRPEKAYDFSVIPKMVRLKESFILGAAAGVRWYYNASYQLIVNVVVTEDQIIKVPLSRAARIVANKERPVLNMVPETEPGLAFMGHVHSSRGESGKVLKIHSKKRISQKNFPEAVQKAMNESFPNATLGLGGVMLILSGKAYQQVLRPELPDFPAYTDEEVAKWFNFYEMSAPLNALGVILSKDPGLDARTIHFHSFGETEGGHYEYDTTPDDVEYLAYFSLAENFYRVDRPEK